MADFGTITGDGETEPYGVRGNDGVWIHLSGTFDTATIALQMLGKDGNWRAIAGLAFISAQDQLIDLPHKTSIRWSVTGAGTESVYWQLHSTAGIN